MTETLCCVLASIPSPSVGQWRLGPLNLRLYGLMIALGVIAAAWLAGRLLRARGFPADYAVQVCIVGVPMGLIGARAYHVITDWKLYWGEGQNWVEIFYIWKGGLGIPGGIVGGVAGGMLVVRLRKLPWRTLLDVAAAAFPLGQAIGRLGNYFNQELFGRPTDLPWGLEIDPVNRPAEFIEHATFHPTFAYEGLWNIGACGILIWCFKRRLPDGRQLVPVGHLFVLYLIIYSGGRLWVESLRADPASLILGVRVNIWVMGAVLILATLFLLTITRRAQRRSSAVEIAVLDDGEAAVELAAGGEGGLASVSADDVDESAQQLDSERSDSEVVREAGVESDGADHGDASGATALAPVVETTPGEAVAAGAEAAEVDGAILAAGSQEHAIAGREEVSQESEVREHEAASQEPGATEQEVTEGQELPEGSTRAPRGGWRSGFRRKRSS